MGLLDAFEMYEQRGEALAASVPAADVDAEVDLSGKLPPEVAKVLESPADFRDPGRWSSIKSLWQGTPARGQKDESDSGFDLQLGWRLALELGERLNLDLEHDADRIAGFVASALVARRHERGTFERKNRPKYYAATAAKALSTARSLVEKSKALPSPERNTSEPRSVARGTDPTTATSASPRHERWLRSLIRGGEVDPLNRATSLIRGMIGASNVGQLVGASGTLKTQFCLELGATLAEGVEFLERTVRPGRALHIFAEGSGGAPARLAAVYKRHAGLLPGDLVALPMPVLFGR
ncbi:AAA family ATPase, partial [Myxococcota bacterium]|nr:AAA family ATPase [Myxococcota bacterium]